MAETPARWETMVRRLFGVKGEVVIPGLSNELVLTGVVEPGNPSHAWLRQERLLWSRAAVGAVVAEYAEVHLGNPTTSHLIIVEEVVGYGAALGIMKINVSAPKVTLGTLSGVYPRDTRQSELAVAPGVGPHVTEISYATTAVPLANVMWEEAVGIGIQTARFKVPVVLREDTQLGIQWSAANAAFYCCMSVREVPIVPQEQ